MVRDVSLRKVVLAPTRRKRVAGLSLLFCLAFAMFTSNASSQPNADHPSAAASPRITKSTFSLRGTRIKGTTVVASAGRKPTRASTGLLGWRDRTGEFFKLKRFRIPSLPGQAKRKIAMSAPVPRSAASGSHYLFICPVVVKNAKPQKKLGCRAAGLIEIGIPPAGTNADTPGSLSTGSVAYERAPQMTGKIDLGGPGSLGRPITRSNEGGGASCFGGGVVFSYARTGDGVYAVEWTAYNECNDESGGFPTQMFGNSRLTDVGGSTIQNGSSYNEKAAYTQSVGEASNVRGGTVYVAMNFSFVNPGGTWINPGAGCSVKGEVLSCSRAVGFVLAPYSGQVSGGGAPGTTSPRPCRCDPVDVSTGDYFEPVTDISYSGPGPDMSMSRTYSSLAAERGDTSVLGRGWSFPFGASLFAIAQGNLVARAVVTNANGSTTEFLPDNSGILIPPPGVRATLVRNVNGTYTYVIDKRETMIFSSTGELLSLSDANGNTVTLTYEGNQVSKVTDWAERWLAFEYDANERLEKVEDSSGRVTEYAYNGAGRLETVTDVRGGETEYTYSEDALLLTRRDPTGEVTLTNTYDSAGRITSQKDAFEAETTFTYTGTFGEPYSAVKIETPNGLDATYEFVDGLIAVIRSPYRDGKKYDSISWYKYLDPEHPTLPTSILDPVDSMVFETGLLHLYTYTADGRTASERAPNGDKRSYTYDSMGGVATYTDGNGVTTTNTYDAKGNLLTTSTPLGGEKTATTTYTYNGRGQRLTATDPNSRTTTHTYDSYGNLASTTNHAGEKVTETHNQRGDRLTVTTARGNVEGAEPAKFTTSYSYDPAGNLLTETDPLGNERVFEYDPNGNKTIATDSNGNTTSYEYDAANRLESETDAEEHTTSYGYNVLGQRTSIVDPEGRETSFTYETNGNLLSAETPSGDKTEYTYGLAGELSILKDPNGNETSYWNDGAGNLVETERPDSKAVKNTFDDNGNRLTHTNAVGQTTSYTYDAFNRLTSMTTPGGNTTTYTYDLGGLLSSSKDPMGRTTSYSYNTAGRLSQVSYSDGVTPTVSYTYDADGHRLTMTDGSGTSSYAYDRAGKMTSQTTGAGSIGYGYDAAGNTTSISYPNGKSVTNAYDDANRLVGVTDWSANTTAFGYDDSGLKTTTTFPAGTGQTDTTAYDANGEVESITQMHGGTVLASASYTRDAAGQVTGESLTEIGSSPKSNAYSYDSLNQLTGATGGAYAYGSLGNPTKLAGVSGYTYNSEGRLSQIPSSLEAPGATVSHNSLGQRTSTSPINEMPTSYGYDQAGNLTQVLRRFYPSSGQPISVKNTYNGDGLLQSQASSGGSNSRNLVWDTRSSVPRLMAAAGTSIIYGPDDVPVAEITSAGSISYYHQDQQGSTRLLTDASGTVLSSSVYDPYGNRTVVGTKPILGYGAQYTDPGASGLIYLRARWYDPATAQFLSQDPLQAVTGQPYTYANNNPLTYGDPSGLILGIPGTPSLSEIADGVWGFTKSNYGLMAEVTAGVICLASIGGAPVCIAATVGGLTASTVQNVTSPTGFSPSAQAANVLGTLPGLQVTGAAMFKMLGKGPGAEAADILTTVIGGGSLALSPVLEKQEKKKKGKPTSPHPCP